MASLVNAAAVIFIAVAVLAICPCEARKPLPFVGEVRWVSFQFAPQDWILCDGREVKVNDFKDLFKVLGTKFGGDGKKTFKVPTLIDTKGTAGPVKNMKLLKPIIAAKGVFAMRHYQ